MNMPKRIWAFPIGRLCESGLWDLGEPDSPLHGANYILATTEALAAPDLYAALEAVLKQIDKSDHWWMDCPDKGGFDADAIRIVLADARGEA